MILLDSISTEEDDQKELLIDENGKYLKKFFEFAKLDINKCYLTTLTKCSARGDMVDGKCIMKCKNLHTVIVHNPTAFVIGTMAFNQANLRNIYVPNGKADAYKTANPTYKDIIR